MVGSVIVLNDKIISEGYHTGFGKPHAEIEAINNLNEVQQSSLNEATIYVNLEPCSHHGKTPPCAQRLAQIGFKRVVIGMKDPNPQVAGRGIEMLEESGIAVNIGVLENEAQNLNRSFKTHMTSNRPHYIAKWATTSNGYMGRPKYSQKSRQISGPLGHHWVHRLRSEIDAILIGVETANQDNPSLTVRSWSGTNPLRVVIDTNGRIDSELNLLIDGVPTLILSNRNEKLNHVQLIKTNPNQSVYEQLDRLLLDLNKSKVLVEGGNSTLEALWASGRMDEAYVLKNTNITWEDGLIAPQISNMPIAQTHLWTDLLSHYIKPMLEQK